MRGLGMEKTWLVMQLARLSKMVDSVEHNHNVYDQISFTDDLTGMRETINGMIEHAEEVEG
jgi:hypothetical protein